MSGEAPIIDYEDSPLRSEICIEQRDGVLRITTPPMMKFSRLNAGYRAGILAAVGFMLMAMAGGLSVIWTNGDLTGLIGPIEGMVLLLGLFAWGWSRLRTHYLFEVTRDTFMFRRLSAGRVVAAWTIRRDRIGDIHASEGRKIVIPLGEGDYLHAEISDSKADAERVADALARAVAANQDQIDRTLPERVDNIDALRTPRDRQRFVWIYLLTAAAIAVVLTAMFRPLVGVLVFFAVLMPMGVVLGTQKKDFWQ